ncbi:biogenesis of lysosome-related organelles complex 1 subunit 2-like [Argonauta hians]
MAGHESMKSKKDQENRMKNEDDASKMEDSNRTDDLSESKEEPPADVVRLCQETMSKTAIYLRGELEGTADEYKLLEQMNQVTINKYSEMKHIAMNISRAMLELDEKYRSLQPYLDQIDQIEESVSNLEQAAYRLDAYSKKLESKFKTLQKR